MRPSSSSRRSASGTASSSLHFLSAVVLLAAHVATAATLSPSSLSVAALAAAAAAVVHAAPSSSSLPVRPLPALDPSAMNSNGIYVGFLPQWGVDEPSDIIRALGRSPAAVGDYLVFGPDDTSFRQVDYHLSEVLDAAKGDVKQLYIPAILFNGRMNEWTPELSTALAQKMRGLNRQGVTVYLRFCYEMNGGWMQYGLQPVDYVSTWRSVTNAIRAVTNETFMVWAPNVMPDVADDDVQAYEPYWPGEEYVDVVGLSVYSFGPQRSINQVPPDNEFRNSFQKFYDLVSPSSSSSSDNPLGLTQAYSPIVAETSAPYYYEIPPSSRFYTQQGDTDITKPFPNLTNLAPSLASPPLERSDDELSVKATWLAQLTGNATAQRFPNLKLVNIFNFLKKSNGSSAEVLADFRFVGSDNGYNATVEAWLRQNFGNQTAYEQGYTGAAAALRPGSVAIVAALVAGAVAAVAVVV
ncbi:glycoside hydrolase family 26 protein [Rhodotorula graminis WP1]|uniref:Glycoside hydrolase family 26 protein n=1 Tax=Rhodotorula graminis (strain WP1) TaxID=578459 RepID=A0A0P9IV16_RHOGW|nr:glycoside hydrolase family 26 protein [Rhodotorula graminis WP1]KPV73393.1 glycoside hydrolase family 26 protein [Rhodotorula graminis WP1]